MAAVSMTKMFETRLCWLSYMHVARIELFFQEDVVNNVTSHDEK